MRASANLHGYGAPAPASSGLDARLQRLPHDQLGRKFAGPYRKRDRAGERAFAEWLSSQPAGKKTDRNAELIADTLWPDHRRAGEAIVRGMRCREGMGSNDDEAR